MTSADEPTLLKRTRSGDRGAFDELCREHGDGLAALIRARLGAALRAKIEPEDILQETLLRAFESIDVFRGEDAKTFFNWLASIAEHLIWNASQKRSLGEAPLVFDASDGGVSPSKGLRRKERLARLEASLSGLKPEQREAILLSKVDGLRVKEIAARMGRSEAAVKQLLSRGLRALRRSFGDTESLRLPDRALGRGGDDGRK